MRRLFLLSLLAGCIILPALYAQESVNIDKLELRKMISACKQANKKACVSACMKAFQGLRRETTDLAEKVNTCRAEHEKLVGKKEPISEENKGLREGYAWMDDVVGIVRHTGRGNIVESANNKAWQEKCDSRVYIEPQVTLSIWQEVKLGKIQYKVDNQSARKSCIAGTVEILGTKKPR